MPEPTATAAAVERLRAAGCVFAEDEAQLLAEAAGSDAELEAMVARRVDGVPVEHIVGWAEFCGLRVAVEPGVFVPRRRTELLATTAARRASSSAVVVDLCCGSGAVALAIATAVPGVSVHAIDIEPAAVRCARRNLAPVDGRVYEGERTFGLVEDIRRLAVESRRLDDASARKGLSRSRWACSVLSIS